MVNLENSCGQCEKIDARLRKLEQKVYDLAFLKIETPLRGFIYNLDESVRIQTAMLKVVFDAMAQNDLLNIVEENKKENEC